MQTKVVNYCTTLLGNYLQKEGNRLLEAQIDLAPSLDVRQEHEGRLGPEQNRNLPFEMFYATKQ